MKITAFYNKHNSVLMLSTTNIVSKTVKEDDIVKMYDTNDKLIGVNIFNYSSQINGLIEYREIDNKYLDLFDNPEPSFVYGRVININPHPKSEKLKICSVDINSEILQIVCGASNVVVDAIVVVAQVGSVMINSIPIVSSEVLNTKSDGMLCSQSELGFEKTMDGIVILKISEDNIGNEIKREDLI